MSFCRICHEPLKYNRNTKEYICHACGYVKKNQYPFWDPVVKDFFRTENGVNKYLGGSK